jgi:catechol 2,3-dioxygenase-like lactoylglutathione lyase family enzyme
MTEVIGIDHIYIAVSDLERSELFYDRVLLEALGFRKNKFSLGDDPHIQYFNRYFGITTASRRRRQSSTRNMLRTIGQRSSPTLTVSASK